VRGERCADVDVEERTLNSKGVLMSTGRVDLRRVHEMKWLSGVPALA